MITAAEVYQIEIKHRKERSIERIKTFEEKNLEYLSWIEEEIKRHAKIGLEKMRLEIKTNQLQDTGKIYEFIADLCSFLKEKGFSTYYHSCNHHEEHAITIRWGNNW